MSGYQGQQGQLCRRAGIAGLPVLAPQGQRSLRSGLTAAPGGDQEGQVPVARRARRCRLHSPVNRLLDALRRVGLAGQLQQGAEGARIAVSHGRSQRVDRGRRLAPAPGAEGAGNGIAGRRRGRSHGRMLGHDRGHR